MKLHLKIIRELDDGSAEGQVDFDDEFVSFFKKDSGKELNEKNLEDYIIKILEEKLKIEKRN